MAKLIVLIALAFTALVAFASAHTTTIVTTTIGDDNPVSRQQCSQQVQGESFNQCVRYLQQGQGQGQQQQQGQGQGQIRGVLQQCCNELQQINEPCQCAAVQHVFQKVQRQQQQQQQGQQGGRYGSQQLQGLKMKAQNLPNQCNLQVRQCPIRTSISTTTITQEEVENPFWPPFGSQQQCSRSEVQGRSFNKCQRYVAEQVSGSRILMSINRPDVQQCCNELQNVRNECQCEAMKEVYRQSIQEIMQQQQQGGRRGQGQGQQEIMGVVRSVVQELRNDCNLDVQQCQIPSSMF